jgi:aerobic-type carbon monoxide dehydrogenase small subunit (CoxS/CutS family)
MTKEMEQKKKTVSRRSFMKGFSGGIIGTAVLPRFLRPELVGTQAGDVKVYSRKKITMMINGEKIDLVAEPQETLLEVLRGHLNLTGSKTICNRGECGGCTVHLDGRPVYACMYLAVRADGKSVNTVEGLAEKGKLHPVQQAFVDKDGYQCGFCTPGFLMTTAAFLKKNTNPSLDEIKNAFSGNLCRCGNYNKIFESVQEAAKQMRRP